MAATMLRDLFRPRLREANGVNVEEQGRRATFLGCFGVEDVGFAECEVENLRAIGCLWRSQQRSVAGARVVVMVRSIWCVVVIVQNVRSGQRRGFRSLCDRCAGWIANRCISVILRKGNGSRFTGPTACCLHLR